MKKHIGRSLAAGTALVFALSFVPAAVWAEDGGGSGEEATTVSAEDKQGRGEALKTRLLELKAERQAERQQKLDAAKLRACENRKENIDAIMARSIIRAERHLALFSTIAERVKAFYEEKGRTVANYDELVAAVDAGVAEAEANLEILKAQDAFECDADDPKGSIEAFKLALKAINEDLKEYRTAVKNLIVGVKSAQSTAAGQEEGGEE